MKQVDVLIVGGGPSGLMMAAELARYGVSFEIIDESKGPTALSKALVLQARTLEILDQITDINGFLNEGLILKGANLISEQKELASISFDSIDSPFPFVLSIEQSKTERLLIDYLSKFGIGVQRETKLVDFTEDINFISATLEDLREGKKREIKAKYLIGCDGAHSMTRKLLQLPFKGKVFSDIFSLADIYIDWSYPHDRLTAFFGKNTIMAAFPIKGENRYRLIFQLERCQNKLKNLPQDNYGVIGAEEIAPPSLREVQQALDLYTGGKATAREPLWMSNFHINSRMSTHYREGYVFLVGDAAHIHSPIGGQGMNTGMQDAFNLAWKLAYVLRYKAPPELLDSYEVERHSIGKKLLKATEEASKVATLKNPLLRKLRNTVVSLLASKTNLPKTMAANISQTAICYDKSAIIKSEGSLGGGPTAGARAPNISLIIGGKEIDLYTFSKNPTLYTVVLFLETPIKEHTKMTVRKLEKELLDSQIKIIAITADNNTLSENSPYTHPAISPSKEAFTVYGVKKEGVYIIRPDGYICFKSSAINQESICSHLKKQINL